MADSTPLVRRSAGEVKKTPPSSVITRNGARKAKIQTRAMSAGAKPSALVIAAKKKAQQKKKQHIETVLQDHYKIAMESKEKLKGATGFVTEPRMSEHKCLWDDNYPECPERLIGVINRCEEMGLIDKCVSYPPRAASVEELTMLHSKEVYDMLEKTHRNNDLDYLEKLSSKYDAVYIHPSTHELSLIAAGSTIDMVDRIVKGEIQNGVAFVRPPGHHAMRAEPCGYCFYNNVALAAKHALDKCGLQRILIVDWDVHHGQATQQMFYDDPRVVYFSIHRYEHGSFWPNLRQSDFHYTGHGRGEGYNFNIPLNKTGMTDSDYMAIWLQVLLPMAIEFQPELILISAGYDAAIGCPEYSPQLVIVSAGFDSALGDEKGEMSVTPACYATLAHVLRACARVCAVLEGGYCVPALAEAAAHSLRALLLPPPALRLAEPCREIRETILNVIYAHRKHWQCYNYQPTYSINVPENKDIEIHKVEVKWEGDETRPDSFATRNCYPIQDNDTKRMIAEKLDYLKSVTDLSTAKHPVCFVYDLAMLKHKNICEPGHPECPERIMRIYEMFRDFGLLERMHQIEARVVTDQEILAVHTHKHLERLKELSSTKLRRLHSQKDAFDSVYFHPDSLESASVAAGCVLQMIDAIKSKTAGSGVCIIRPPGHHADEETPSGFCLINNVAVAAKYAIQHGIKRVLIVDWDVHHGNGTQRICYDDDQILYISIHRYDNGKFFPNSKDADFSSVGKGRGEGFNINIPWNEKGMGDTEYLAAMTQVVLPIAYEYNPELVLISAGFDACVGDPLGQCNVTPECYGFMTNLLKGLAAGRVILCLEGGYNTRSISYAMTMCTKALLGDPIHRHYEPKPICRPSAIETINNVIKTHKKYWKSLKFQIALPIENVLEPPAPSRGLNLTSDVNNSIETKMACLNISNRQKCSDGIHCGTDDEDDKPGPSKSNESNSAGSSDVKNESASDAKNSSTLIDYLSENMQALVDGEMFAVVPLQWCPHLESLYAIPENVNFEQGAKCVDCDHVEENWVCLHCYITACGRHINGHMQHHYHSTNHALALSLSDLSVWCSACDAYVDHRLLYDAKNNAHRCKFGEDMPWCYTDGDMHVHMQ